MQAQIPPEELETVLPKGRLAIGRMITGKGNGPLPVSLRPHFVAPHFVAPPCTSPRLARRPALRPILPRRRSCPALTPPSILPRRRSCPALPSHC
jgi:hypothetical protein